MDAKKRRSGVRNSLTKQIKVSHSKRGGIIPKPKPPKRPPEGKGKK